VANPREGREDYLRLMNGVVFGDSPAQGVVRDNALLHVPLGLAIKFPAGWQVRNQAERVVAVSPKGDALVELRQGPRNDQPLATLQKGLRLDGGTRYERGKLAGYPAAFAAGTQQGKPVLVSAVVFNGAQYLIAGIARDQATYARERSALRAAINSFHALTAAEKKAARPHRLSVITATPGTSFAALARSSPLGADAENQLRLMNDLYPTGEPRRGQRLKIVQ
jgi:predicted Zn-dependent protease